MHGVQTVQIIDGIIVEPFEPHVQVLGLPPQEGFISVNATRRHKALVAYILDSVLMATVGLVSDVPFWTDLHSEETHLDIIRPGFKDVKPSD